MTTNITEPVDEFDPGPIAEPTVLNDWGAYILPVIITVPIYRDGRGSFVVLGSDAPTRQTNLSTSYFNVIRGMHWQTGESAITKHVRCIGGTILDVVVDMREGSSTWGRWKSFTLSGGASSHTPEQQSLVVPKGFAHGFQAVSANVTVLYEQDGLWNKEDEREFNPLDPEVGIGWEPSTVRHRLSEKDASAPGISVFA